MTEKLYYENTYLKTFTARVQECKAVGDHFDIRLNRTAFYPEGGGQPCDRGVLNFADVLDVQVRNGEIVHITNKALPVGTLVIGGIDWPRRFRLMQQHTGEHIVSGIAHRFFDAENVGFHMSDAAMTVDWNKQLSEDQIQLVERMANEAVYRNISVESTFPSPDELGKIDYRSKKELSGTVRIVFIPGYDICACCGTHVKRTGEIGTIKIIGSQNYKGGTRITLVCGTQAIKDYDVKQRSTAQISALLSAKEENISAAAERIVKENSELKREIAEMHNCLFELKAESVPKRNGNICVFEKGMTADDLRRFAMLLAKRCSSAAAVFCESGGNDGCYRYAISSVGKDLRPVCKDLNGKFGGRGGGSKELVQGSLHGSEEELLHYFND